VTTACGNHHERPPRCNGAPHPASAITLATALCWIEHRCAQHCSSRADPPAASWCTRRRNHAQPRGSIVVDPTDSLESVARIRRLLRDINSCTPCPPHARPWAAHGRHRERCEHRDSRGWPHRLRPYPAGRPGTNDQRSKRQPPPASGSWPSGGAALRGGSRTPRADLATTCRPGPTQHGPTASRRLPAVNPGHDASATDRVASTAPPPTRTEVRP
jgi:hypothetical protein